MLLARRGLIRALGAYGYKALVIYDFGDKIRKPYASIFVPYLNRRKNDETNSYVGSGWRDVAGNSS
jgi:hypothetical protein